MPVTKKQQAVADALVAYYEEWVGYGLGARIDRLVKKNKFAYLVGVMLDGGNVKAGQAWEGLLRFNQRLKERGIEFTPEAVAKTHLGTLKAIAVEQPCIAHYHANMARFIKEAARKIMDEYDGDAAAVFEAYTAREVYFRLMDFKGIKDKKANMAVRLLIDELGEGDFAEVALHIPVDVQVERVFYRTGLANQGASRTAIQRMAIDLCPDAPWKLDAAWSIGFSWCKAQHAWCSGRPDAEEGDEAAEPCPLKKVCLKVGA